MQKELLKSFTYTSITMGMSALLFGQALLVGSDSVITNAMIQAGWCGAEDYICLLGRYICIAIIVILLGLVIDLWRKYRVKKIDKALISETPFPIQPKVKSKLVLPEIVSFSTNIDEILKKRKAMGERISGISLGFINDIKSAPPFLGLKHNNPVISPKDEQTLTDFFLASMYVEKYRDSIKGGDYTITRGDTQESIAKSKYGNKRYKAYIPYYSYYPNGTILDLPYVNLETPDSNDYIKRKIELSKNIEKIKDMLESYHLVRDESIYVMRMVYDASQMVLNQ